MYSPLLEGAKELASFAPDTLAAGQALKPQKDVPYMQSLYCF